MSESVHQGSRITCVFTHDYLVTFRQPASVEYHACRSQLWMTALWHLSSLSVPKGQFSRGMPVWVKNAENVRELLRLDCSWQGRQSGICCH